MYSLSTCDWNELEFKKTSSQTGHSQYTHALVAFTNSTASATASAPAELPILAQCAVKSSTLTVRKLQTSSSVSGNALRRERDGGGGGGTVAWWETPVRASASARTPRSRSRATATRHCGVAAMRPRPDTAWRAGSVGAPTASARALREGLAGPARVEERGGEGGGDLGAPRREPRRAAERRDRVPGPRERGARVADDVVRERGAPVARGEALRRGAVVFADGQGAQGGLRLLAEGGGRVLPVRVGRRRRRGGAPVPGHPSLVPPASHGGGGLPGRRAGEVGESGGDYQRHRGERGNEAYE